MGDSKSGSKSDLNESNMPLLEEEKVRKKSIALLGWLVGGRVGSFE